MKARASVALVATLATAACAAAGKTLPETWVANEENVPARLVKVGDWQMSATRLNASGTPECFETWTFRQDGTGTLISGKQEIIFSWRYSTESDVGPLLYKTFETSTGSPDCLNRPIDHENYPYTNGKGYELLFFGNGASAYVCRPPLPATLPDGTRSSMQTMENCWGGSMPSSQNDGHLNFKYQ